VRDGGERERVVHEGWNEHLVREESLLFVFLNKELVVCCEVG